MTDFDNWCSADKAYSTYWKTPDEPKPSCWNDGPTGNVWFKFTATDTYLKAIVKTGDNEGTMRYAQMAIVDASNNVIACQTYLGEYTDIVVTTNELVVGQDYWIEVDHRAGSHPWNYWGNFTLCLDNNKDYDWKEYAYELTDISDWCSVDKQFSTYWKSPDEPKPSCWPDGPTGNVWFKFTATSNVISVNAKTGGTEGTIRYLRLALWDNSGNVIGCNYSGSEYGDIQITNNTMIPGDTYFISVDHRQGSHPWDYWGNFTLCIHDGTIMWTGATDTDWNTASNWNVAVPTSVNNAEIPATAPNQPVLTGTGNCNDLRLNAGAQMTITTGSDLNVNGNLILEAGSSGTASLVDNGSLNVTGSTNVEHYYSDNRWHFISSPLSSAVSNVFLDIYLKDWSEPTYAWTYITATNFPLVPGTGYEIWSTLGDPTVSFTGGSLNNGDISPAVSATDANNDLSIGDGEGWNLVGNPYPSAIDLGTENDPVTGYIWTNLDSTVYFWNGVQYASFNLAGDGSGVNGGTRYVPSAQSFFIKAKDFTPALTIPNSARLHNTQPNYKSSDGISVRLVVEGNGYSDEMLIRAMDNAKPSFDSKFDAYKLWGISEAPQLFSIVGDYNLSINTLPEITGETVIPVGLKVDFAATCTLKLEDFDMPGDMQDIYLKDLKTGIIENLSLVNEYTFEAEPIDNAHRFDIYFAAPNAIEENNMDWVNIYSVNDIVYIKMPDAVDCNVYVYNMTGKQLISKEVANSNSIELKVSSGQGIYFVKVISDKCNTTKKVWIK